MVYLEEAQSKMTDYLNATIDAFQNDEITREEVFAKLQDKWFSTVKIRTNITGRKGNNPAAPTVEKRQE